MYNGVDQFRGGAGWFERFNDEFCKLLRFTFVLMNFSYSLKRKIYLQIAYKELRLWEVSLMKFEVTIILLFAMIEYYIKSYMWISRKIIRRKNDPLHK